MSNIVAVLEQYAQRHGLGAATRTSYVRCMSKMPIIFVGHGSPMNALEDNEWTRGFADLGQKLPEPKGILAISAHWYLPGTFLTGNDQPPTIHDFGGFPRELFEIEYPARGDRQLAERVAGMLEERRARLRDDWGLDHGTWTVLHHLRPAADVPVVQLSIDARLRPEEHLAIGRALAPLREQGVLIFGTGNVTHNLRDAFRSLGRKDAPTPAWASTFDAELAKAIDQRDTARLSTIMDTPEYRMSHPTPDHYLPLLYAASATDDADAVSYPTTGWDAGSLSMRSIRWG
jgi:4,5-DOPA dioxygenase extradiol